ncbi:MAG: DUF983 domain-containing protein [Sphingobacteriales bacterium]|nr:DUF983 domain-containing protein [Sphingobacteriales bacterium]MBP6665360.1 DUF983 domain-containing protein [Chitinophagales bacterium]
MFNFFKSLWIILSLRCPNCGKAKLFSNPSLFNLKDIDKMPPTCPHCKQDFVIEPEFYYGGMFISYILVAFIMFFIMGLDIILSGYLYIQELFVYIGIVALGWTYWFRLARSLWLAIYVWWIQPHKDKY